MGAGGRPIVHFVLGGPGSGKSTNCKRIAEAQGFRHISVGQLRRQEAAKASSKYGDAINKCLDYGDIIAADVAIEMLEEEMKRDWGKKTFLIDGFPRNLDQLKAWQSTLGDQVDLGNVILLQAPESQCCTRT